MIQTRTIWIVGAPWNLMDTVRPEFIKYVKAGVTDGSKTITVTDSPNGLVEIYTRNWTSREAAQSWADYIVAHGAASAEVVET
jgi:hypothetical protein